MTCKRLKVVFGILLSLCLLLPYTVLAQDFDLPEQARQLVSEDDMVEMIGHMTRWKSADLFAHLEATDEILTPFFEDIRGIFGPEISLPDVAAIRAEYEAKIIAIYQSATIDQAESRVTELIRAGEGLRDWFQDMPRQLQPVAARLEKMGAELQQELPVKIDAWVRSEEERIRQLIDEENEREKAALQVRMEQQAMEMAQSLAAAAGQDADPEVIRSQVDAAMAPIIEQAGRELQEKMMQRGKELEQQMRQAAEQKADELSGGLFSKLAGIRDSSQGVRERIEQLAQQKMPYYDVYHRKFLEKKGEIIGKTIDAQLASAEQTILSFADKLEMGRREGRDLPSADELISRLNKQKQELAAQIMQAETDAEIDQAVSQFRAGWEDTRKSLEAAMAEGTQEIIDKTRVRLQEGDVEARLRKAVADITKGIANIEKAKAQGEISAEAEETLQKLRQLLPQVKEGLALIEELKRAEPADGIEALLRLKDRLQEKLESIQRCCHKASFLPGPGIFIEAENEMGAELLPRTELWHSSKEVAATWRPGASGGADWYLSRGGENLIYSFEVPEDGAYVLWIRDLASDRWPRGTRSVIVNIDGVDYGEFAENADGAAVPDPGAFGWHKTATAFLDKGVHTLVIIKAATTSAAAILDCFYFTSDPEEIPR